MSRWGVGNNKAVRLHDQVNFQKPVISSRNTTIYSPFKISPIITFLQFTMCFTASQHRSDIIHNSIRNTMDGIVIVIGNTEKQLLSLYHNYSQQ